MNVMMGVRPMLGAGRGIRYGMGAFGIGPLEFLFTLFLLAVVVALVAWLVLRKQRTNTVAAAPAPDAALAIARERLARGEIDAEQYISILTALTGQGAHSTTVPADEPVPAAEG